MDDDDAANNQQQVTDAEHGMNRVPDGENITEKAQIWVRDDLGIQKNSLMCELCRVERRGGRRHHSPVCTDGGKVHHPTEGHYPPARYAPVRNYKGAGKDVRNEVSHCQDVLGPGRNDADDHDLDEQL